MSPSRRPPVTTNPPCPRRRPPATPSASTFPAASDHHTTTSTPCCKLQQIYFGSLSPHLLTPVTSLTSSPKSSCPPASLPSLPAGNEYCHPVTVTSWASSPGATLDAEAGEPTASGVVRVTCSTVYVNQRARVETAETGVGDRACALNNGRAPVKPMHSERTA
jgi:hypothetical protein